MEENSINPSYTFTQSGLYNVSLTVTSPSGCVQTSVIPVTVVNLNGKNNIVKTGRMAQGEQVEVPVSIGKDVNGLYVDYNVESATSMQYAVYNVLGEQVAKSEQNTIENSGRFAVALPAMSSGVYTIEVIYGDKKIVKKIAF
jgi:hypothetical protein